MSSSIRLSRINLVSFNPKHLARFYVETFGFKISHAITTENRGAMHGSAFDLTMHGLCLKLGDQEIEIREFQPAGQSYPPGVTGSSSLFQHFAIVVSDIEKAYQKLSSQTGWTPISQAGPVRLSDTSGGVTAFKFRDPEGHPLELISFPSGHIPLEWRSPSDKIFLGIDHSAISVADTSRSVAFYQSLGFMVSGGSFNHGIEQARLDDIPDAQVEVTSLLLPDNVAPHVELLCYRDITLKESDRPTIVMCPNDIAATQLAFELEEAEALAALCAKHKDAILDAPETSSRFLLRDPDGHLIALSARAS